MKGAGGQATRRPSTVDPHGRACYDARPRRESVTVARDGGLPPSPRSRA